MIFETVKRLYFEGKLSETALENAVLRGWITGEQRYALHGFRNMDTYSNEDEKVEGPA